MNGDNVLRRDSAGSGGRGNEIWAAALIRQAAIVSTALLFVACPIPRLLAADIEHQASAELMELANYLVQEGRVHLSGHTSCEIYDSEHGGADAFIGSDAGALLSVASRPRIYLFLHGFYANLYDGRPPMNRIRADWRGHIELVRRESRDFVACLFANDTAAGFGEHQPNFGNFLFALRWLTDDPELYDPDRRIFVVTYSAGFGYAKYGYHQYSQSLVRNGLGKQEAALTPTRFVFLGAPHFGTDITGLALLGAGLFTWAMDSGDERVSSYDEASRKRAREAKSAAMRRMAASRGASQLTPNNQLLRELDSIFLSALPDTVEIFNVYSTADIIVSSRYSRLSYGENVSVASMGHGDFLAPGSASEYARLLSRFYAR